MWPVSDTEQMGVELTAQRHKKGHSGAKLIPIGWFNAADSSNEEEDDEFHIQVVAEGIFAASPVSVLERCDTEKREEGDLGAFLRPPRNVPLP